MERERRTERDVWSVMSLDDAMGSRGESCMISHVPWALGSERER